MSKICDFGEVLQGCLESFCDAFMIEMDHQERKRQGSLL